MGLEFDGFYGEERGGAEGGAERERTDREKRGVELE